MRPISSFKPALGLLAPGAGCCVLSGCTGTVRPAAITPARVMVQKPHSGTVQVQTEILETAVKGETVILTPGVFTEALQNALRDSGLLAGVNAAGAAYRLEARITGMEESSGFTVRCKLRSVWRLTRLGDNQPVWTDFVEAEEKATVGEALNGFKRMRLAVERATKALIREGIERLGRADWP